jgi:hypothetical protein
MKKITAVLLVLFVAVSVFAGGKKDSAPASSWEWLVNGDKDNGGTSTINMTEGTEEGVPAYTFKGNITNKYEYGFVNVKLMPDPATLEQLKKAKAISFRVLGDGEPYAVKITTSDVKDYAYFEYRFDTVEGKPLTIIVPVEHLMQPSWGKAVGNGMINLANAQFIEYQTTRNGSPGPYEFKLWDFRIHTAGVPKESQIKPKGKPAAAAAPAAAKGIGGDLGAFSFDVKDNFLYGDGYQGVFADKRLMNGHKIVPGEKYVLKITYTTSRDLEDDLMVGLVDTTPAANYWRALSWDDAKNIPMASIPKSKAGEKVSVTIKLATIAQATGVAGVANALVFTTNGEGKKGAAGSGKKGTVTLNFTEFVFTEDK